MKELELDFQDLECAMELQQDEMTHYLDKQTGEIITIMDDISRYAEEEDIDHLQDWEKRDVELARKIESNWGNYIHVENVSSREGYRIMVGFAHTVKDENFQEKLFIALDGRGAFRRFKDVLYFNEDERQRFFKYHSESIKQIAEDWLESEDIKPVWISRYPKKSK
ncbi:MAG: UPF0158 family protein [Candidatus Eremiobacteraeota bacterium]|nr:UPF0158 family protein [Candidatus Eremiobacteraeota bacterium]